MDIKDVPLLSRINRNVNVMIANFLLLALVSIVLGVLIPLYPEILTYLVSAILIVSGLIFLNVAFHIYATKRKYTKWFDK